MKTTARKLEYHKLTFILSVLGFIGSIGFYVGVLRQVYSPDKNTHYIELLQHENAELKETIKELTDKTNSHE
jgi:hypothetical protein